MREAAYALGAPNGRSSLLITLRAAGTGVVTGILLALARISGETAPCCSRAVQPVLEPGFVNEPMANLPVTIFKFAMSPFQDWQQLAWAGVFITLGVLVLNIIARVLFRQATPR